MRVVLDTGVVISALLFLDVLRYPKFGLRDDDIAVLAGLYLPHAERIENVTSHLDLPAARDPGPFISVAQDPGPGTYAMHLAGLGMLGFMARRRMKS